MFRHLDITIKLEIYIVAKLVEYLEIIEVIIEDCDEHQRNINTAKDVEVCEVRLRNTDHSDKRCFGWSIQSLAVSEQLQNKCWKIRLAQADDAIVDDHEHCEEDENGPYDVDINIQDEHLDNYSGEVIIGRCSHQQVVCIQDQVKLEKYEGSTFY